MAVQQQRPQGKKFTRKQRIEAQAAFLSAYAVAGTVQRAAASAGIDRQTFYRWREMDTTFAAQFDSIAEDINDRVRAELDRRAIEGWDEPVYQGGKIVGNVHRYSDRLLALMARRLPEYKEARRVDVSFTAATTEALQAIVADPDAASRACDLLDRMAPRGSTQQ